MKYKVGDRVRIKSIDWYNENKDKWGVILLGLEKKFYPRMAQCCRKVLTIKNALNGVYITEEFDTFNWTDEMIEGLVEEPVLSAPNITEGVFIHEKDMKCTTEYILPDGYIFKDENCNVINATKIVLEKKKKEYPKTLDECRAILGMMSEYGAFNYKANLITTFMSLLICRDAYWKIAGEEMGLGKPWKNSRYKVVYGICRDEGNIVKRDDYWGDTHIFEFPTREMRDAFYENFKEEIEICKELL